MTPSFSNPDQLYDKFNTFLEKCKIEERIPTVTGFSHFVGISRETFYEYKNNKIAYSDTFKKIEEILEEETLQINYKSKNPAFGIFHMKNKFNWSDKQEIKVEAQQNQDISYIDTDKIVAELKASNAKNYKQITSSKDNN